jgi:hypothetical protein
MGDALAGYLFSHQLKVTSYDIANLVKAVLAQEKPEASTVQAGQQSIIDKLIQEELLRFTSLDDFAAAQPIGVGGDDGAQPLDAGLFENPADWFSDDAEVDAALGAGLEKNTTGSDHGWRESGLEGLAGELEADPDLGSNPPPPSPTPTPPRPTPPRQPPPREVQVDALPPVVETVEKKGGSGAVIALVVLLLLGAGGAAAYFLTTR